MTLIHSLFSSFIYQPVVESILAPVHNYYPTVNDYTLISPFVRNNHQSPVISFSRDGIYCNLILASSKNSIKFANVGKRHKNICTRMNVLCSALGPQDKHQTIGL